MLNIRGCSHYLFSLVVTLCLLTLPDTIFPCQIEYSDRLINAMRDQGGVLLQKRVGNFANLSECEAAMRQAVQDSGDPSLAYNMRCVGCSQSPANHSDSPEQDQEYNNGYTDNEPYHPNAGSENDHREKNSFLEKKKELIAGLKGSKKGSSDLKIKRPGGSYSKLTLKTGAPPDKTEIKQDLKEKEIKEAVKRIVKLRGEVAGIQVLLRQYTKSLSSNAEEFEVWGQTVDKACNNVLETSKEYISGLFMDNILSRLKALQKVSPEKLGRVIDPSDSAMRSWFTKELGGRSIDPERFEKLVKLGMAEGDLAALINTDEGLKKNLDALILFSDLLDVSDIPAFKNHPFQHARIIGETYSDLASVCYSWFSINRLEKDTEKLSREVDSLAVRMRKTIKEIECLESCTFNYTEGCMEKCAGKTRFHSPPPVPR
ncbi:MAG: hypothetical protein JXL81_10825 [Deltaproteobacteria bacterium]|nr:hypothetical protein [Deltaproteobacteria bacterium]